MAHGKAPSSDGQSMEFFVKFLDAVRLDLVYVLVLAIVLIPCLCPNVLVLFPWSLERGIDWMLAFGILSPFLTWTIN